MKWPDLLTAFYGKQWKGGENEITVWMDELERAVSGITDEQICNAIRANSHEERAGRKYIDLKALRIWVCMWRKRDDEAEPPDPEVVASRQSRVNHFALRIATAGTTREILDAMYDARDEGFRLEDVEAYALRIHPNMYDEDAVIKRAGDGIIKRIKAADLHDDDPWEDV